MLLTQSTFVVGVGGYVAGHCLNVKNARHGIQAPALASWYLLQQIANIGPKRVLSSRNFTFSWHCEEILSQCKKRSRNKCAIWYL